MRESIVQSIRSSFNEKWGNLPSGRKLAIGLVASAVIAGIVGIALWVSKPDYKVLFSNLSPEDMQAIEDDLRIGGIPHRQSSDGSSILIPSANVPEVRWRLASRGLPEAKAVGLESFNVGNFGMTDFTEQVKYKGALAVELKRSLELIKGVKAARVQIAIPRPTVFTDREQPVTAGVVLDLHPGCRLNRRQIDGVVHLVASMVEGLHKENVTIVDTSGEKISRSENESVAVSGRLEYQQAVESGLESAIENMLAPVLGHSKAMVQVAAEINFNSSETTSEIYSPDGSVPKSETTTESSSKGGLSLNASGVPGVQTNITPNAQASESSPEYNRSDSTTEYEVSKTIKRTVDQAGGITKLSVAVILDNKMIDGTSTAWTPQELKEIEELVGKAVGIDALRDDIKIMSMAFDTSLQQEMADAEKARKQEQLMATITKAGIGIAIFLFLIFALRAVLKRAASSQDTLALPVSAEQMMPITSVETATSVMPAVEDMALQTPGVQATPDVMPKPPAELSQIAKDREEIMELLKDDPEKIAKLIRGWLSE